MTIEELAKKITECCVELERIGAVGGFVMDNRTTDNSKVISVQFSAEDLPKSENAYYTKFGSNANVLKHVTIGKADFYAVVSKEDMEKELFG